MLGVIEKSLQALRLMDFDFFSTPIILIKYSNCYPPPFALTDKKINIAVDPISVNVFT